MKRALLVLAGALSLAAAGCDNLTSDQRFAAGGLAGAGVGLAAADAMDASGTGRAVGALAGAAVGSSLAANYRGSRDGYYGSQPVAYPYDTRPTCRYSDGSIRPCPPGY